MHDNYHFSQGIKLMLLCMPFLLFFNCRPADEKKEETTVSKPQKEPVAIPTLRLEAANHLAELPMHCIQTEYPNKLGQTLGSSSDLKEPKVLHPAFYGCFDWHSAVHGHWSLVSLLKQFPELDKYDKITRLLLQNISLENIQEEVRYFHDRHNLSFERTYGWAWVLKLAEELHTWNSPLARELEANLQPLTDLIVDKYRDFLPKLNYPIRVGEHSNTAFGLAFAYDYATAVGNETLKMLIVNRSKDFYYNDTDCPLDWEPSGFDFLSPCLEEAALMRRVLPLAEFQTWLIAFLPQLKDPDFSLEMGKVSERTDGKLVHLDGVNFSRAWSLYEISKDLPEYAHLKNIANAHVNYSLPSIVGDSYEGGHWLGSFAIYALNVIAAD